MDNGHIKKTNEHWMAMHDGTVLEDALYAASNDEFDEMVFSDQSLLDQYNDWPDDDAREMLYEIISEAQETAKETAFRTIRGVIEEHSEEFIRLLKQKWACPDCSDEYAGEYVILDHTEHGWECPKCGCGTSYPEDDACIDVSDWMED